MVKKKTSPGNNSNSRKTKPKQNKPQDTCFTIMPFGDWFDYYYETIYVPAIKLTGLVPRRADDLYRPSAIVHDIWTLTQQAKVVLADLSSKNANVFYELGLAHALTKPAILVTESMEDVPFDLRSLRVITYEKNDPNWGDVLQEKIKTSIEEVLAAPLEAVLPTFLKVKESAPARTVSKEQKESITLKQDLDLVKRQLQALTENKGAGSNVAYGVGKAIAETGLMNGTSERSILEALEFNGFSSRVARSILNSAQDEYTRMLMSGQGEGTKGILKAKAAVAG